MTIKQSFSVTQIYENQTDIAFADLTVTSERLDLIEFSVPISETNVIAIARRPSPNENNIYSFMNPLTSSVWIASLGSFVAVAVIFSLMQMKDIKDSSAFASCLWFTIQTLFGLRNESLRFIKLLYSVYHIHSFARLHSLQVLRIVWSIFAFLMVSCYTANLAASLTIQKIDYRVILLDIKF